MSILKEGSQSIESRIRTRKKRYERRSAVNLYRALLFSEMFSRIFGLQRFVITRVAVLTIIVPAQREF